MSIIKVYDRGENTFSTGWKVVPFSETGKVGRQKRAERVLEEVMFSLEPVL